MQARKGAKQDSIFSFLAWGSWMKCLWNRTSCTLVLKVFNIRSSIKGFYEISFCWTSCRTNTSNPIPLLVLSMQRHLRKFVQVLIYYKISRQVMKCKLNSCIKTTQFKGKQVRAYQAYSSFRQKLAQPLGTSSKEFPQSTDPRQAERDSKKPIKYAEETPSVCLWGNISVTWKRQACPQSVLAEENSRQF